MADVLAGQINSWIPDLLPDMDDYFEAIKQSGLSVVAFYQQAAENNNRPIWGTKLPEWNVYSLAQVYQFLPESRIIYLVRNLADCLRSAKAIEIVRGFEEAQRFCHTWKQNKEYALQNLKGERVLHLDYENLISNPTEVLKRIALFTQSEGIDSSVLNHKINTYTDANSDATTAYLKPVELEKNELALIDHYNK